MTFIPATPIGGYAGWRVFERSAPNQLKAFERDAGFQRDVDHFRTRIASATDSGALLGDRRLLKVALGAFGLDAEIGKRAIIRRVLDEGAAQPEAFANKLSDPRWREFARAFGYGDLGGPNVDLPGFADRIVAAYRERAFEAAVGESEGDFRLALNFRREAKAIAGGSNVDRVGWFQLLGQRPIRAVLERAFNLPTAVATLDIDRQRAIFEEKAQALLGSASPAALRDDKAIDAVLRRFFAAAETGNLAPSTRGAAALTILSGAAGLIQSNAVEI